MPLNRPAEEKLQIIRTLMEGSVKYRTLSVAGAGWGGLLSVWAFLIYYYGQKNLIFLSPLGFLGLWGGVFLLATGGNLILLFRESRQKDRPLLSPSFLTALVGVLPAFLVSAIFTLLLWADPFKEVIFWLIFYGLGLLGTQPFAPRAVILLGWAFTLTGAGITAYMSIMEVQDPSALQGTMLMALTFGCYHLFYAVMVYLSLQPKKSAVRLKPFDL